MLEKPCDAKSYAVRSTSVNKQKRQSIQPQNCMIVKENLKMKSTKNTTIQQEIHFFFFFYCSFVAVVQWNLKRRSHTRVKCITEDNLAITHDMCITWLHTMMTNRDDPLYPRKLAKGPPWQKSSEKLVTASGGRRKHL